jgi:hypothetical protein
MLDVTGVEARAYVCPNSMSLGRPLSYRRYRIYCLNTEGQEAATNSARCAHFRQKFVLEDAIGSHACLLEALACM